MITKKKNITIALASIPNTGKTTLFNQLTGSHQSVGNWAGVSVEKKVGTFKIDEIPISLIDLPGTYSISATSLEEQIVSGYLFNSPPDIVISVLDARNLYRSLGLTLQLAQSGLPIIAVVNMMDEARREGLILDMNRLSEHLKMPVIPIVARTGEGLNELKQTIKDLINEPQKFSRPNLSWPPVMESAIMELARKIEKIDIPSQFDDVFIARRMIESKDSADHITKIIPKLLDVKDESETLRKKTEKTLKTDLPTACARCRFNAARGLVAEAASGQVEASDKTTERIDNILMNKFIGLPLFFVIMFLMFQGIYSLGLPIQDFLSNLFVQLSDYLRTAPVFAGLPTLFKSFIIDGIIQGVGIVISFFPLIVIFFVFMSIIEDSGYMTRAAFLMDRLMHSIGLDGKAFINILLGYGCNVPAIMGTRILSSRHNRIITMLLIPFTLCSARMQVFVFFVAILFSPTQAPLVLLSLYLFSFVVVIIVGLFMKIFKFAGKPEPYIIEMPPYRRPMVKTVAIRAWQEMKGFLNRASTLIVLGVVLVWILTNLPVGVAVGSADSWAGIIGHTLLTIFKPLGIVWQEIVALLFGFVAKEIVVGSLAVIYGANPAAHISATITPLQGLSFMIFTLLYTPCIATIATIRAESRSWKIMLFSIVLGVSLAWIFSFTFYHTGMLLGFG